MTKFGRRVPEWLRKQKGKITDAPRAAARTTVYTIWYTFLDNVIAQPVGNETGKQVPQNIHDAAMKIEAWFKEAD